MIDKQIYNYEKANTGYGMLADCERNILPSVSRHMLECTTLFITLFYITINNIKKYLLHSHTMTSNNLFGTSGYFSHYHQGHRDSKNQNPTTEPGLKPIRKNFQPSKFKIRLLLYFFFWTYLQQSFVYKHTQLALQVKLANRWKPHMKTYKCVI